MGRSTLTPKRAGRVYDRIGRLQDRQGFYERPAVEDLVAHAGFEGAHAVFEFGCGTGATARELLDDRLPVDATYTGVDVSRTMVRLATDRLRGVGDRAAVHLVDGRPPFPGETGTFDRFVALYVLDLLSDDLASDVLDEAARLLGPDGRLCLVGLTEGTTIPSKIVAGVWTGLWRLSPALLGGCRPIDVTPLLDGWTIDHSNVVTPWGVPSRIVVAHR